jgi:hypothetical protein
MDRLGIERYGDLWEFEIFCSKGRGYYEEENVE